MEYPTRDCCVLYGGRVSLHLNSDWIFVLWGFWVFFFFFGANESKADLEKKKFFALLDGCLLTVVWQCLSFYA